LQVVENIIREDRIKSEGYQAIIKAEIVKLLSLLGRGHPEVFTARSGKRDEKTQTMIRVINYLTNHYTEKISISDMSRYANMSLQHFCRTFKAYTGKTLVEFLTHLKLEKAYRLIITTDVPISQIPELAGFCNINYFSRVFRKRYGATPSSTRSSQLRSGL
jgi:transcriptional regulator GlxA family with amidase domain